MILLANLMIGLGNILDIVLGFFIFVLIVQAVISWFSPDPYNPLVRFLYASTQPIVGYVRRRLPRGMSGPIDFASLIVLLGLLFLKYFVAQSLLDYGRILKIGVGVGIVGGI